MCLAEQQLLHNQFDKQTIERIHPHGRPQLFWKGGGGGGGGGTMIREARAKFFVVCIPIFPQIVHTGGLYVRYVY